MLLISSLGVSLPTPPASSYSKLVIPSVGDASGRVGDVLPMKRELHCVGREGEARDSTTRYSKGVSYSISEGLDENNSQESGSDYSSSWRGGRNETTRKGESNARSKNIGGERWLADFLAVDKLYFPHFPVLYMTYKQICMRVRYQAILRSKPSD